MKKTEKQAIAEKLQAYVESKESQNKAAKTLKGVSPATVSQVLNGNWELISEDMWRTIATQIGYDARKWAVVQTEGYNEMYEVLSDAQENALVFAVIGDAGCGKSQAIKVYGERNRNTLVLSCSEYWNRKQFLVELLRSLGVDAAGCTVVDMMADAVHQLKRRDGVLLVLDEADKLSDQILYFFITLYNQLEDHIGIVLCATQHLEKRITKGVRNNRKGYREIYSRIARKFVQMPVVNASDIAAVCMANGITDKKMINEIVDDSDCDLRRVKRLVFAAKQSSNND
ncbi:MAG: ATP-binding protein [Alistipes sp.]|nr:ATP-binding protein [Alistipes sp.]